MDSINRNQEEDNVLDYSGHEAGQKIKELCEKAKNCFFCTGITHSAEFNTRPMSVQKIDEDGTIYFLSSKDSHKNQEITADSYVQLLFQASTYSGFVSLFGRAIILTDKEIISDLWDPLLKTWFTEGVDDPRISVIQFTPETGYYWETKHGQIVAFAKQVAGAVLGKTMDDSIEGSLKP